MLSKEEDLLAVDTETTGLELRQGCLPFSVQACDAYGATKVWEWDVDPLTRKPHIPASPRCSPLGPDYLMSSDIEDISKYLQGKTLVSHNAPFDILALTQLGLEITFTDLEFCLVPEKTLARAECPTFHDTMLMSHAYNSQGIGQEDGRHGLKQLALYYLDIDTSDEDELKEEVETATRYVQARIRAGEEPFVNWKLGHTPTGERRTAYDYWLPKALHKYINECCGGFDEQVADPQAASKYGEMDVIRTIQLYFLFESALESDGLAEQYLRERDLSVVIQLMENNGLHLHTKHLKQQTSLFQRESDRLRRKAVSLAIKRGASTSINLNSGVQLANCLKDNFDVQHIPKTEKGNYKTDDKTLRTIAANIERKAKDTNNTDEFRKKNTDISEFLRCIVGWDSDKDEDNSTKKEPGYKTYDSGVRYLSSYTSYNTDDTLYPNFNQSGTSTTRLSSSRPNGQNISKKASIPLRSVFGPDEEHIWVGIDYSQLELRLFAYLSGDSNLMEAFERGYDFHNYVATKLFSTDRPTAEQRRIAKNTNFALIYGGGRSKVNATAGSSTAYDDFVGQFESAGFFMDELINQANRAGYVDLPDGYRVYVPKGLGYKALNYLVQGTAGRIVKLAMLSIHARGIVDWTNSAIIANIHDELLLEYSKEVRWQPLARRAAYEMSLAGKRLGIPCPVEATLIEHNWQNGDTLWQVTA